MRIPRQPIPADPAPDVVALHARRLRNDLKTAVHRNVTRPLSDHVRNALRRDRQLGGAVIPLLVRDALTQGTPAAMEAVAATLLEHADTLRKAA